MKSPVYQIRVWKGTFLAPAGYRIQVIQPLSRYELLTDQPKTVFTYTPFITIILFLPLTDITQTTTFQVTSLFTLEHDALTHTYGQTRSIYVLFTFTVSLRGEVS